MNKFIPLVINLLVFLFSPTIISASQKPKFAYAESEQNRQLILDRHRSPRQKINIVNQSLGIATKPAPSLVAKPINSSPNQKLKPPARYRLTDLGTLGGAESYAVNINNAGDVIGYSLTGGDSPELHSFVYRKGRMRDTYPFFVADFGGKSINNAGFVLGETVPNGTTVLDNSLSVYNVKTRRISLLGTLEKLQINRFSSINDFNQIVGDLFLQDGLVRHSFLYSKGKIKDLGSLGEGGFTRTTRINNQGMVAGISSLTPVPVFPDGQPHIFFYQFGKMKDIHPKVDPAVRAESIVYDLNDTGQLLGNLAREKNGEVVNKVFIYEKGRYSKISDDDVITPTAMNKRKEIVGLTSFAFTGTCFDENGNEFPCTQFKPHAALYKAGIITDLNNVIDPVPGWELELANDINNWGQIVGYGFLNGQKRAFLLTPKKLLMKKPVTKTP